MDCPGSDRPCHVKWALPLLAGAVLVTTIVVVVRVLPTTMKVPEALLTASGYRITLSGDSLINSDLEGTFIISEKENPERFLGLQRSLSTIELNSRVHARTKRANITVSCLIEPTDSDGTGLWIYPVPLARLEDKTGTTTYECASDWYYIVRGLVAGVPAQSDWDDN